jgi:hypothetical protein
MELPVDVAPVPSPFDSLRDVNLRAGLERTGIIPMVEFDREEFVPPAPLPKSSGDRHLAGTDDIPVSAEAVKARLDRNDEAPRVEAATVHPPGAPNGLQLGGTAKNRGSVPPPPRREGARSDPDLEPTLRPPPQPSQARDSKPAPGTNGSADLTLETHRPERRPPPFTPAAPPPRKILSEEEPPTNPRISISDEVDAALDDPEQVPADFATSTPPGSAEQPLSMDLVPPRQHSTPGLELGVPVRQDPPRTKPHSEPPAVRAQPAASAGREAEASNGTRPIPEATRALVDALMHGRSLTSADRAQLVLAIGRLLVRKGLLTAEELALALSE